MAAVFMGGALGAEAGPQGACGQRNLAVSSANLAQSEEVCTAIREVRSYLAGIGFTFELRLSIAFKGDVDAEAGDRHAHGFYNPVHRRVVLYARERATPWGEPWSEVAGTFLRHEVVHAAVVQIVGTRNPALPPEWHEFIAYAIQFELMAPVLRERVLERYASVEPVRALTEINPFTYGMADPAVFAVMVHKTYRAFGGRELIRRLLAAEFVPIPLELMMPFPPK